MFVLPSACILTRADLFRALGGYDQGISFHGDDVDLCWRAHLSGRRVSSSRRRPASATARS